MKLRMAEQDAEFKLFLRDATRHISFRMYDDKVFKIIRVGTEHIVTILNESTSPASIDTDAALIVSWLTNDETVILVDNGLNIESVLRIENGSIFGDGVNLSTCIMRRYTLDIIGNSGVYIETNGPMTEEEILAAVLAGWES